MNLCGAWCYRAGYICDRNRLDTRDQKFICSNSGGECTKGDKFEYWDKASSRDLAHDLARAETADLSALGGLDEAARRNPRAFTGPEWDEMGPQL